METDRGACLTVRAAARGVIDFSRAQVLDVAWWRRTNALINAMAQEDDLKSLQVAFAYQCALVGNGQLDKESFSGSQKAATELFYKIINALYPWTNKTAGDVKREQIDGLIDMYKRIVGDPNDPEFRAKLEADIAAERERRAKVAPESDEDRVERLMRARDAARSR